MGRPLQYLLRTQANSAVDAAESGAQLALRSKPHVDAALERCMEVVDNVPGLKLRVNWDGPAAAAEAGDLPQWARHRDIQLQVLQLPGSPPPA